MALWAGRFSKEIDAGVNAFNSSISFDARMYRQDIEGSIAHATMLGDCGIIPKEDSVQIIQGLKEILADLDSGKLEFDPNAEDIHMFVEAELTKRYGDVGKRLHTSRSRNDQVALDLRLYLRTEIAEIRALVRKLCKTLVNVAGLYAFAACTTGDVCTSSVGICTDVAAGFGQTGRHRKANECLSAGQRCSGRNNLPHQSGTDRRTAGF